MVMTTDQTHDNRKHTEHRNTIKSDIDDNLGGKNENKKNAQKKQ